MQAQKNVNVAVASIVAAIDSARSPTVYTTVLLRASEEPFKTQGITTVLLRALSLV